MRRLVRGLTYLPKRHIIETKDLKIAERGGRMSYSGICATIFGPSSQVGLMISDLLLSIGSRCIYPYRHLEADTNEELRDMRSPMDLGNRAFLHMNDFTDEKEIMLAIRDQNVVINCIGNRFYYKTEAEYELANTVIPKLIAKCVKKTPTVKRFIHVSAAGADPHSPSIMLRTKWHGEQAVREIYPEATILKPTIIYSSYNTESSFVGRWTAAVRYLTGTGLIIGDGTAKIQPVYNKDVAQAIYNCLKMKETIGQTYELGGPTIYTYKELYELMFNSVNLKPYMVSVPLHTAFNFYNSPAFTSLTVSILHNA